MNLLKTVSSASRIAYALGSQVRYRLPRQRAVTFCDDTDTLLSGVGPVFVINLDRQSSRWTDMVRELDRVTDAQGLPLSERVVRFSAYDAQSHSPVLSDSAMVHPMYTLGDQLFVEPQPHAQPDAFDLERPINMTRAEVAVARSHISVWKAIANSNASYSLVLEDDVWFERGFGRILDQAWQEMESADQGHPAFDILYVSYGEVRHGAPKELVSKNVFKPERGLWFLSGYVLSKKGAQALLELLPCRGPVDLWINHKFGELDVRALRRSVVNQRRDLHSTNSYSILPTLSRIGVLDRGDAALFHRRPTHSPVFAFGEPGSGLSSLAMALSMLGYRCCSDLDTLPECELENLLDGRDNRVFDAYVNVGSLESRIPLLIERYPSAKYIVMGAVDEAADSAYNDLLVALKNADVLRLQRAHTDNWRDLCEHLKIAPPSAEYPSVNDIGIRRQQVVLTDSDLVTPARQLQHDPSPWIAKRRAGWDGINTNVIDKHKSPTALRLCFEDDLAEVRPAWWSLRNDTFPGNLGLFRPANVTPVLGGGRYLTVIEEPLGVRNLSAAAISSRASFLFGRFEATLQATNVPGLVTGFFLHRNSPRQEIDIEILGNQPDRLLVNVFYNPGAEGAKFDYGYRGTPAIVELGFDASKALHQFAIEWDPNEIRWFVDQKLVHRRANWNPTPIPHLPMTLHVNTWPSNSRELAGRLPLRMLPASAILRNVAIYSYDA